jgi:uncharacterized SAM-binding protein YcdF (DUF218 family)
MGPTPITATTLLVPATSPYFLLLLVLIAGTVLLWAARGERIGRILVTVAAGFLLLIGWSPFADLTLRPFETRYPPVLDPSVLPDSAWVVVLGGGVAVKPGSSPVAWLAEASLGRLVEGIRLHQALPGSRLVVTGAAIRDTVAIATALAAAAVSLGVDPAALIVEDRPRNTAEEAARVAERAPGRPLVLVTSASHMPRAVRLFEERGLQVIPAPTHYMTTQPRGARRWLRPPSADNVRKVERAVYELLAGLRDRIGR